MRTVSVQNSTSSLPSDILPDNSIQTGANAGAAASFLVALDFRELVAASVDFGRAPKPASETTPSKNSQSEDRSLAQSAAESYLGTRVQAMPAQAPHETQTKQAVASLGAAAGASRAGALSVPAETQGGADSMHLLIRAAAHPAVNLPCASPSAEAKRQLFSSVTQGSAGASQAAISTSSDSSSNPNSNGAETLQILACPPSSGEVGAQLLSRALLAIPITEGSTMSRFQESTQWDNLTAGLSQPAPVNGSPSRKSSTPEGSTLPPRTTSGQSEYTSVQSSPLGLLQPVDPLPIRPIASDPSVENSAEPAQAPRFSGTERQLADRNYAGSDETQISTTRDDTVPPDPIAFEAKISSVTPPANSNQSAVPHPNSQVERVESVDAEHIAAELKPEDLSPSASAAMVSFSGTPSADTKRPITTAPEMPIRAKLDPLLESERPAESHQIISVNLTSTADRPVNVRFVERSGEVHVTVRTADPALAQDFRSGLSDLSGRLEHAGFRAEVSSQSGTDPSLERDSEQASPDSRNSGRQNSQSQREPPERHSEDASRDRRNPHSNNFAVSVNNLLKEQDA